MTTTKNITLPDDLAEYVKQEKLILSQFVQEKLREKMIGKILGQISYNDLILMITQSSSDDWIKVEPVINLDQRLIISIEEKLDSILSKKKESKRDEEFKDSGKIEHYFVYKPNILITIEVMLYETQSIKDCYPPHEIIYNAIDPSVHGENDDISRYQVNIRYNNILIETKYMLSHDFGHRPYLSEFPILKDENYTQIDYALMRIINGHISSSNLGFEYYIKKVIEFVQSKEFRSKMDK